MFILHGTLKDTIDLGTEYKVVSTGIFWSKATSLDS